MAKSPAEYGFRRIASEAHATQLMRREIKQKRAAEQRYGHRHGVDYAKLLAIKPGAWYRFTTMRRPTGLQIIPAQPEK